MPRTRPRKTHPRCTTCRSLLEWIETPKGRICVRKGYIALNPHGRGQRIHLIDDLGRVVTGVPVEGKAAYVKGVVLGRRLHSGCVRRGQQEMFP